MASLSGNHRKPRVVFDYVYQADLHAIETFGVVHNTQLETMGFLRNVHQPGLKTLEVSLGIIDPTVLPADKAFVADVDDPH